MTLAVYIGFARYPMVTNMAMVINHCHTGLHPGGTCLMAQRMGVAIAAIDMLLPATASPGPPVLWVAASGIRSFSDAPGPDAPLWRGSSAV